MPYNSNTSLLPTGTSGRLSPATNFPRASSAAGSQIGPDFGKDKHNPSRDAYKTKDDVVKLLEDAVAAGAEVIKQQGEAGLDKTHPFASRILTRNGWVTNRYTVHTSYMWLSAIEHSAEHFGQLVVYYRANNLIPPESRR